MTVHEYLWDGGHDRPKSAKAILKKFLEDQGIHDYGDVQKYVYEGRPGASEVLAVTVVPNLYVPAERWSEEWFAPDHQVDQPYGYVLRLDLGYEVIYSLAWFKNQQGVWRYRGGSDGWTENVPLAEVEHRIGQKQDDQADD